jgi:N-methylhydantoinase A
MPIAGFGGRALALRLVPSAPSKQLRVGVDVGGTFTDLIVRDEHTGEVLVGKVLSSPGAPEDGVLHAIGATLADGDVRHASAFVHGTTVGLNALLERRGATVGLLATRGFRDVLEVRRGDRDDPYDLFWSPPPPLVPRRLRRPIAGRVRADGAVHEPLDPDDVRAALDTLAAEGVDAIAVAFINAYANPAHELEAERLLRAAGFTGEISLSHRVSGEYREYERTCTTAVDAFVRGRMGGYLRRLQERLGEDGLTASCFMTRSGGGAMTFEEAADRPFETIMSGPVAGVAAVGELARELDLDGDLIAADVGGTSFDTCLVADGRPPVLYQGEIVGLPLQTPWVDVRSIGAGGGSIAMVDAGGLLRVGPRSAGASPGPACYGRGGQEPTVTDAALALGMLADATIAGDVQLRRDLAEAALEALAAPAGLDGAEDVARGAMRIASAHMADAIRGITVEQGRDPRGATIVAFGGAGGIFGTLLADELGVDRLIVPIHAGNFSAWGLLGVDLAQTASRTQITPVRDGALAGARPLVAELLAELDRRPRPAGERRVEIHLDIRYVGQEHTLTVAAPQDGDALRADAELALHDTFSEAYSRTFGHTMDEAVEIVTFRVSATTPLQRGSAPPFTAASAAEPAGERSAWSFARGERCMFATVERAALAPGDELAGPAIVHEPTATTYLDAGFVARVHAHGHLIVERDGGAGGAAAAGTAELAEGDA